MVYIILGPDSFRSSYFVAQENIIPITSKDNSSYIIKHRNLNNYFLGYDPSTKSYRISHLLRYCFPYNSTHSSIPK